jgi:amino-acid N-acetyltransferase
MQKRVDTKTTRPAKLSDVAGIARLVEFHAQNGKILPRSAEAIEQSIDDWIVINGNESIIACGSLYFYSPHLAEVRSLAVETEGVGLGSAIVEALIEEAQRRGVQTLFALTRVVHFFERLGFTLSDKNWFPEKIWRDCADCPVQDECDENAVVLHLSEKHSSAQEAIKTNNGGHHAKT